MNEIKKEMQRILAETQPAPLIFRVGVDTRFGQTCLKFDSTKANVYFYDSPISDAVNSNIKFTNCYQTGTIKPSLNEKRAHHDVVRNILTACMNLVTGFSDAKNPKLTVTFRWFKALKADYFRTYPWVNMTTDEKNKFEDMLYNVYKYAKEYNDPKNRKNALQVLEVIMNKYREKIKVGV